MWSYFWATIAVVGILLLAVIAFSNSSFATNMTAIRLLEAVNNLSRALSRSNQIDIRLATLPDVMYENPAIEWNRVETMYNLAVSTSFGLSDQGLDHEDFDDEELGEPILARVTALWKPNGEGESWHYRTYVRYAKNNDVEAPTT